MDSLSGKTIAQKTTTVFLVGAALLLLCYGLLFKGTILVTENTGSTHRLMLIAPHYFSQYNKGKQGIIEIDPLLTSYDQYQLLPPKIQQAITPQWTGVDSLHFDDDDSEFAITAQLIDGKIYYLLENIDAVEWSDDTFILIEILLLGCGIILFLIAAIAIKNTSKKIAEPFSSLAQQLSNDSAGSFEKLVIEGTATLELEQTLTAINNYREKIALSIEREQSFTRYVSHELRTPMTVIKGCLSLLKKQDNKSVHKQCSRISDAINEMQALTQTFLLLARDDITSPKKLEITQTLVEEQLIDLASYKANNHCSVSIQVLDKVVLLAEPTLFNALINNLLINAINCSPNGHISLFIDQDQLRVVDNGSGLDHNHRGYEGFGIGLVLVKDICEKYQWSFSLENNDGEGCTAKVLFNYRI